MLQDNSLIFFESKTAPETPTAVELDGSSYGRDFVFCTIRMWLLPLTSNVVLPASILR